MKIFGFQIGRSDAAPTVAPVAQRSAAPSPIIRRGYSHAQRRSFEAGRTDRITSSWTTADQTINQSLLTSLRVMRARSRAFFRDNEYGRKFAALVRANVVGHSGFSLKFDCRYPDGRIDKEDSARVTRAYRRWAKRGQFEVTGKMNEALFDQLAATMIARDGEVLVRIVTGKDRGIHGIQLQLLPGHLLDEEHNVDLTDGRRIRMGVEFDAFMKPLAYHLRLQAGSSDMHGQASRRYERVPASEMLHLFIAEDAEQWRGIPWVFAGLRDARLLDQFDEAALVAANIGASKMGFFRQQDGADGMPIGVDATEVPDVGDIAQPEFTTEVNPGQFDVIPDGYTFEKFDPDYPSAVYEPFTKAVVRRMATGTGLVSYHSLSGDLTEVSFSSIRQGTLDEREAWKIIQSWFIAAKEQIVENWLSRALINDSELQALPYAKFDKYNAPVFGGRRWDWVDPKSDVAAAREAVALGVKSRAQIIRDGGDIPEDVWAELDAEKERGFAPPQSPGAAAQAAADATDTDPPKKKG